MEIVAISDTHNQHAKLSLPPGDVLIHAGDFTTEGTMKETISFMDWFEAQPHPIKIVVPGNHDRLFAQDFPLAKSLVPEGINLLMHDELVIGGIHFFGSSWTPEYGNYAFQYKRGSLDAWDMWNKVPVETNVLITHGPPAFIGDRVDRTNTHAGCVTLLNKVLSINPMFHVFGHIHDSHGLYVSEETGTKFANVAICDGAYNPVNSITVLVNDEW